MHTQYSCNLFSGSEFYFFPVVTNMIRPVAQKERTDPKGHKKNLLTSSCQFFYKMLHICRSGQDYITHYADVQFKFWFSEGDTNSLSIQGLWQLCLCLAWVNGRGNKSDPGCEQTGWRGALLFLSWSMIPTNCRSAFLPQCTQKQGWFYLAGSFKQRPSAYRHPQIYLLTISVRAFLLLSS